MGNGAIGVKCIGLGNMMIGSALMGNANDQTKQNGEKDGDSKGFNCLHSYWDYGNNH